MGTSGSDGGGGGNTDCRLGGAGGPGGWRTALAEAGAGVGRAAWDASDFPGRGWVVGLGLETALVACDGPPALRSFPAVIGRTTPGFLLAGGRDVLLGDSPEGTCIVWLLYMSSLVTVSSLRALIWAFLSFFLEYSILYHAISFAAKSVVQKNTHRTNH